MSSELKSYVERIERLNEDKKAVQDDIKSVYGEAKDDGFDTKILRTVVKLRSIPTDQREEQEALIDTYLKALEGTKRNV